VSSGELAGRRVLVTRAAHQAGKLSEALRARGIEPVEVPVLEIQLPLSFAALDAALRELPTYDWLIVTSANTVRALVERAEEIGVPLATAERCCLRLWARRRPTQCARRVRCGCGARALCGRITC